MPQRSVSLLLLLLLLAGASYWACSESGAPPPLGASGSAEEAGLHPSPDEESIPSAPWGGVPRAQRTAASVPATPGLASNELAQPVEPVEEDLPFVPAATLERMVEGLTLAPSDSDVFQDLPDPVTEGDAELLLSFHDARDGTPVAADAQLWHIDAPASVTRGRGDQYRQRLAVGVGATRVPGLAPGTYRLVVADCYEGAEALPPFEVGEGLSVQRVGLDLPRVLSVHLALFDARGRRVQEVGLRSQPALQRLSRVVAPTWELTPRKPLLDSDGIGLRGGLGGAYGFRRSSGFAQASARQGWFHAGECREASRRSPRLLRVEFRSRETAPATRLELQVRRDRQHWVSALVEPDQILERILLPDGRDGRALADAISIQVGAVPTSEGLEDLDLLDVPVRIKIGVPGLAPEEKTVPFRDLPMPYWRLRELEAAPGGG